MTTTATVRRPHLTGSPTATRLAVGILEVLSGVYGPVDGSRLLGLSQPRYYALEARAVQGMIHALEPQPRGRRATNGLETLRREKAQLERTVQRLQALVRATQRAVAITPPTSTRSRKAKRGPSRGVKVIAQLRARTESTAATRTEEGTHAGTTPARAGTRDGAGAAAPDA
jgi:hypothetical protein